MVRELAQIAVELFYECRVIRGALTKRYYLHWDRPGSRMFIVPADETAELMIPEGEHLKVIRRFAAIRVQAIGETDAGLASGLMDEFITASSALVVVGPSAQSINDYARLHVQGEEFLKRHTWIGIFDVDEITEKCIYMGPINMDTVMMKIGAVRLLFFRGPILDTLHIESNFHCALPSPKNLKCEYLKNY